MAAHEVVVGEEAVEVALHLLRLHVPSGPASDAEAFAGWVRFIHSIPLSHWSAAIQSTGSILKHAAFGYDAHMSKRIIKVFLIGTRKDLAPFWAVAASAVRSVESFEPASMDEGAAAPIPPVQWSRREASIPDLYLALLGRCYGNVPSGQDRSLTEQEYDVAEQVGIDRLIFLTEASDLAKVEAEGEAAHVAVERFRAKARRDVVFSQVTGPADFRAGIVRALNEWERRSVRGVTTSAENFYESWLKGSADFGHQDNLLAREDELAKLEGFCKSTGRVLVVEATWGQGKSRLLLELARKTGKHARFVRDDAPLSREALDISAVDPCVIVLEDAQRRNPEDVRRLLAFVQRCGPDVKLIVSSRPSHAAEVLEAARQLGFAAADVEQFELKPLDDREHGRLVAKMLGGESEEAHIIAQRTKGSVLAGVVTARQFRRGAVTLGQIESGVEFRHAVLRVFEAALKEHRGQGVDLRFQDALKIVALAGPLKTDDEKVIAALAGFLDWRPHVLRSTLSDLVDAGFLIRRGDLVRVPADAIAEEMRREACVGGSGESLGYAEDALTQLWPVCGGSLLRNLASMAYELKEEGLSVDFLSTFWPRLKAMYDTAPASVRLDTLEALENAAPYAPAAMLDFVRHALPTGLGPEEEEVWFRGQFPLHLIHDRLAKLLEGVAYYHAEHVGEACDLLWELAALDERDPNRHTRSAERILQDASKLRPRTGLACYQALLRWARRRSGGKGAVPGRRLARYVAPLLEREAETSWSDGHAIHINARGLSAKALEALRREVLDFLEDLARDSDLGTVAAALDGIGSTLSSHTGAFGRQVTSAEVEQWYPEELVSLARLKRIREHHGSHVVDLCVLSKLDWVAGLSPHIALRDQAAELLGEIRKSLASSLELALSHAFPLYHDMEEARTKQHDRDIERIAAAHVRQDPATIAAQLRKVCEAMRAAGQSPDPTAFSFHLAKQNPDLGEAVLLETLKDPDDILVTAIGGLLDGLSRTDAGRATAAAEWVVASGAAKAKRELTLIYRHEGYVDRVGPAIAIAHLGLLVGDTDAWVRMGALTAIAFRTNLPIQERVRLLLEYDLPSCPESGEEWAHAIHAKTILDTLTSDQLEGVARKMAYARALKFWCCEVIEYLSGRVPDAVVDMLVARVPREGSDNFEAVLDRTQKDPLGPLTDSARERGMIALGELLRSTEFPIAHAATDLFGKLATGDLESMRRVRLAWIQSGEEAKVSQAIDSLASEESEFLIQEEVIIVELLEAAERLGPEFLREAQSSLHAIGHRGVRTGGPGEPFSRDVALRDEASAIAARYPEHSTAGRFYRAVARGAQSTTDYHRRREDELSV